MESVFIPWAEFVRPGMGFVASTPLRLSTSTSVRNLPQRLAKPAIVFHFDFNQEEVAASEAHFFWINASCAEFAPG